MIRLLLKAYNRTCRTKKNTYGISETSKCRGRLSKYCVGVGLDLGYGGDAINDSVIRLDFEAQYSKFKDELPQLVGDAKNLFWFNDGVLDYIFSSHLLEDFENTEVVLQEWMRVLKPGGMLVLFCPNEKVYREHCRLTGQQYNTAHVHEDFGLDFLLKIISKMGNMEVVYSCEIVDDYSFDLVLKKTN